MIISPEELPKVRQELGRFLRQTEGSRAQAYQDSAGKLTIGVGHLLTKQEGLSGKLQIAGKEIDWSQGLTEQQIDDLLRQDVQPIIALAPPGLLARHVKQELTTAQVVALASFAFNVGGVNFLHSTLLSKVNQGKWQEVPDQFMRWVHVGKPKKVVRGLVTRRIAEVKLWETA